MLSSHSTHAATSLRSLAPAHLQCQSIAGSLVALALAAPLGVALAWALRRSHLHWSWALLGLVPVAASGDPLGGATLVVLATTLRAARRGRRWHRADLDAGADLAEIALARLTIADALRGRTRALAARTRALAARHLAEQRPCTQIDRVPLGIDERGRAVSVALGGDAAGRHTLVVGATGSGKTVTQTLLAARAIESGMGAVVIDPKGDASMRQELRRSAAAAGRRFVEWTPAGPCTYNPYDTGTETEIADKLLAGERFTEPHYMRQAQRYLGHAVRALRAAGTAVSLARIVEQLDPDRLEVLARSLPDGHAQATFAYLDSLSARQRADLSGVRDRLAIVVESDVGRWLEADLHDSSALELRSAVSEHAVVYYALEADRRPLVSQMLGAAIVQDLLTTVAALQHEPTPTLVVIDEFSAVATEQIVRLFARARSAGFSLLLATQELSDLRLAGHERLLERVLGNLSTLIAHRQVVPSSAEMIAALAGTAGSWKVASHSDGRTVRSRTREPVIDPSSVMSLARGWGAVIDLEERGAVSFTRVFAAPARR